MNDQLKLSLETYTDLEPYAQTTSEGQTLSVLSLFSGCGGMDLGFEGGFAVLKESINQKLCSDFIDHTIDEHFIKVRKTRFNTIFANDILSSAQKAWTHHFEQKNQKTFHLESIVDLVKKHRHGESVFPHNVDIVTGGFPCQDFSVAGKRKGFQSHKSHTGQLIEASLDTSTPSVETRGQLYMWMKEVIEITQPKIFIAENVKGLVNLDNVKEIIQQDFSSAHGHGYLVLSPQVLNAANFGVPQSRERVFFIGIKKSALKPDILKQLLENPITEKLSPYPQITHINPLHVDVNHKSNLAPFVALQSVFSTLVEPEQTTDLTHQFYSKAKFMGKHCQGQTEIKLDGIAPTIRAEHHGNIEFRRLSKEHGGKLDLELEQGLTERRLTPRECALIQTFPPDYDFVLANPNGRKGSYLVSPSQAYKIIGNAVPPLLAYHLAKRIESLWDVYFN